MKETQEYQRIAGKQASAWQQWGAYVSARAWGVQREAPPGDEQAWERFPFEQARSRVPRWTDDGIGGVCDLAGRLYLTTAFWNGRDPILKERFFGLSNDQGNHGEDVKDYWYFLDATPSHSYMTMLYKYPQVEFPYGRLLVENAIAGKEAPAFRLVDALRHALTSGRYFDIIITLAKAEADDLLYQITAINRAEAAATLHLLPQLFFHPPSVAPEVKPGVLYPHALGGIQAIGGGLDDWHMWLDGSRDAYELLFTDNVTNSGLLEDDRGAPPFTRDGIDNAIVRGLRSAINPAQSGSKCAARFTRTLAAGASWTVRVRLNRHDTPSFTDFDAVIAVRQAEADAFYRAVQPRALSDEQGFIQRRAFAGLLWNKNVYRFNVRSWLKTHSDTAKDREDWEQWAHFDAHDLLSVPDPWEYPWLANWDLCFQIATLCLIDPEFAKAQARMLLSERFMHPNGALPGFEGELNSIHPPVIGWTVWKIYVATQRDRAFLQALYPPLMRHLEWWLDTQQVDNGLFTGGFLGKDNISLIDRNQGLPPGGRLFQVDATAWVASFILHLLSMAVELGEDADAVRLLDHFLTVRAALPRLWDETDSLFYDQLVQKDGGLVPIRVQGLNNLLPLIAVLLVESNRLDHLPLLQTRLSALSKSDSAFSVNARGHVLLSLLTPAQTKRITAMLFSSDEFFAPYGLRSVSRVHEKNPARLTLDGKQFTLRYTPEDAREDILGGNSNWRGPVWAPLNHVFISSLYVLHAFADEPAVQIEHDDPITWQAAADILSARLISLFIQDKQSRRPVQGDELLFQNDPHWRDLFCFHEFFNGETGHGLGAAHQNGWSAFIGDLIQGSDRVVTVSPSGLISA